MQRLFRATEALYTQASNTARRPWGLIVPVLALGFVAATVVALTVPLQSIGYVDKSGNPVGLAGFAAFLVLPFGGLALVVVAWTHFAERQSLATIGLTGSGFAEFARGEIVGFALAFAIAMGIYLTGAFTVDGYGGAFHSASALGSIAVLFFGFGLQGSAEEMLFRGWVLSRLAAKFGIFVSVIVSSAMFTAMHFDPSLGWIFPLNCFLFSVFCSCWSTRSGNIWGVMAFHGAWNWTFATGFEGIVTGLNAHLPALFVKLVRSGPFYLTGGAEGPEASCVCTVVLIGAIAYLLLHRVKRAC